MKKVIKMNNYINFLKIINILNNYIIKKFYYII